MRLDYFLSRMSLISILAAGASLASPSVHAQNISVTMNEATILRIGGAADTVVVGNKEIADATVRDAQTIVLTGKGFGRTNIVVLDQNGSPIVDEKIVVRRQDDNVRIYRQSHMQVLSCTPFCEGAYKSEAEKASDDGGN